MGRLIIAVVLCGVLLFQANSASAQGEGRPVANPLSRLLRGLLMPRSVNAVPEQEEPDQNLLDSPAPRDPELEAVWRAANQAHAAKDWTNTLDLLQRILDHPGDAWVPESRSKWTSLRALAQKRLMEAPVSVQDQYRGRYAALAAAELAQAKTSGDHARMGEVARRYFQTAAGQEAAQLLAMQHVDRGEYGLALRWMRELQAIQAPFTKSAGWKTRAAFVANLAGEPEERDRYLNGLSGVEIAGRATPNISDWLNSTKSLEQNGGTPLTDWPQLGGTARRDGFAATSSEPLLWPQWTVSLTESAGIAQRWEELRQDLADQGLAVSPAATLLSLPPLLIQRDLRGVRVLSAATGQTLWHTSENQSAESILNGFPPTGAASQEAWRFRVNQQEALQLDQVPAADHPLVALLARDAAWGSVSSDGRLLFLLEDQAVLTRSSGTDWSSDDTPTDPYGQNWKENRLSAYDLATGRPIWSIGGPKSGADYGLPLAGAYFHGAPTVDRDELFAIATIQGELRLCALDRATGSPLWTQLIAYPESKIDADLARRWIAASPSVGQGVIVCPTTVGWYVAIEKDRRVVLWAHECEPRSEGSDEETGDRLTPVRELTNQWETTPPVIHGTTVILAPAEADQLQALDLITGKVRWSQPRNEGRWIAGIWKDHLLVVGKSGVTALALSDGQLAWFHRLASGEAPAGRPALAAGQLTVALTNGELLTLQADDGTVIRRQTPSDRKSVVGNLLWVDGCLIAQTTQGLARLSRKELVQTELAETPNTPTGKASQTLWKMRLAASASDHAQIWTEWQTLNSQDISPAMLAEARQMTFSALESLANATPEETVWQSRLREFAKTAEERARVESLELQAGKTSGLILEPALKLLDPASSSQLPEELRRPENSRVLVTREAWIAGQLQMLWDSLPVGEQKIVAAQLQEPLQKRSADLEATAPSAERNSKWIRFLRETRFYPAWPTFVGRQIQSDQTAATNLAGVDLWTERLLAKVSREQQPIAQFQKLLFLLAYHLNDDASLLAARLEAQSGDVVHPGFDRPIRDLIGDYREKRGLPKTTAPQLPQWPAMLLESQQSAVNYVTPPQKLDFPDAPPSLQNYEFKVEPQDQRLTVYDRSAKNYHWMVPLRSSQQPHHSEVVLATSVGRLVVIVFQNALHLFSPIDRKVLWTRPLAEFGGETGESMGSPRDHQLWEAGEFAGESPVLQRCLQQGPLVAATADYVATLSGRTLVVFDTLTGERLWQLESLSATTVALGLQDRLILWDPYTASDAYTVYATQDGRELPADKLGDRLDDAVGQLEGSLILWEKTSGLRLFGLQTGRAQLRRYDVATGEDVWSHSVPGGSRLGHLSQEEYFLLEPGGLASVVSAKTGEKRTLAKHPGTIADRTGALTILQDREHIYLVPHHPSPLNDHHYAESLPSVAAHGTITAWSRATGEIAWSRAIKDQHLIVDHFEHAPLMAFIARGWERKGNLSYSTLHLAVWHKQTGRVLYEQTLPSMYSGFHSLDFKPDTQTVDLIAYNLRVRLQPATVTNDPPVSALTPANR